MSVNNISVMTDAVKYLNGEQTEVKETSIAEDVKGSIFSPITLLFGISNAKGSLKGAYLASDKYLNSAKYKELQKANEVLKNASAKYEKALAETTGSNGIFSRIKAAFTNSDSLKAAKDEYKAAKKAAKKAKVGIGDLIQGVKADKTLAGSALNTEKSLSSQFKSTLAENVTKYDEAVQKTATGTGPISTIKRGFKSVGSKIASHLPKGVKSFGGKIANSSLGKALKGSGAGSMALIEGGLELFTQVVPAFKQGGAEAGFKQIGKSAGKVAASAAGWAGGSTIGKTIGGFIGSCICPGAGTAIGGAIGGFLGGMIGSTVLSKGAEKITGKSETEILKEKQYEQAAAELSQDAASKQELGQYVMAKVQEDIQTGNITEDTEKMAKYLQMGAFGNLSAGVNQTGSAAISPAITAQTTPQSFQTAAQGYNQYQINPATTNPTNWTEVAQKINQGDTSIYNISDDKLNSLFTKTKKTKNEGNTSLSNLNQNQNPSQATSDIMFKGNKDVVNYFA